MGNQGTLQTEKEEQRGEVRESRAYTGRETSHGRKTKVRKRREEGSLCSVRIHDADHVVHLRCTDTPPDDLCATDSRRIVSPSGFPHPRHSPGSVRVPAPTGHGRPDSLSTGQDEEEIPGGTWAGVSGRAGDGGDGDSRRDESGGVGTTLSYRTTRCHRLPGHSGPVPPGETW